MNRMIVKCNSHVALVNRGDMGFWVIVRMDDGKRIRVFAGGTLDNAVNMFNWYRR